MKKNLILNLVCFLFWFTANSQKPTVTTNTVTNVTFNSAKSGGNVTSIGGSDVTERGIVYNKTGNPTTSNTKIASVTADNIFGVDLTGLDPSTKYYIKAYAINKDGTGYGESLEFTTAASTDPVDMKIKAVEDMVKELDRTNSAINAFIANQKGSIFKFGISIAVRTALNSGNEKQARAVATISPNQNLVQIDYNDRMAVVISSTVAAYPFKVKKDRLGK